MINPKVEQFLDFVESRPPAMPYQWSDATVCALGQFNHYDDRGWEREFKCCNTIASLQPQTFGGLARRLRAAVQIGDLDDYLPPQRRSAVLELRTPPRMRRWSLLDA